MAIEKMHFLSIVGLVHELDDFVLSNIVPFEIQLVDAYETLDTLKGIQKFSEENQYEKLMLRVKRLAQLSGETFVYDADRIHKTKKISDMEAEITEIEQKADSLLKRRKLLEEEAEYKKKLLHQIKPLDSFQVEIDEMFHFQYMKFRYGKMPTSGYLKLLDYSDNLDVIVHRISQDEEFSYVMYFTPASQELNMDALFASLYFERIRISDDIYGKPHEAMILLEERLKVIDSELRSIEAETKGYMSERIATLEEYYQYLVRLNGVFDVRRFAVHTDKAFYLAGWIPDSQMEKFKAKVRITPELSYVIEDENTVKQKPPTKLHNFRFFRPFESIVKMYGVPAYEEMDPTVFVGITYMLLFGIMFGDVGQGLVIAAAGLFLSQKKKIAFAKLLIYIGVMSTLFGFVYGSVFGNEELLRHLLPMIPMINPMEVKMELLGISVVFGVFLLLLAMLINLFNLWKRKDMGRFLFDKNGITGLVFYLTILYILASVVLQKDVPLWLVIGCILVPIIILFLSERLVHKVNSGGSRRKPEHIPSGMESFFELVEILLSIFSNTISFVRVGAFALNHVGFFMAFHQLSRMVGGAGSIAVMVFGNILIIVLEGLIVGIQGLRLEYYELFSRFYKGDGKEFVPYRIQDGTGK